MEAFVDTQDHSHLCSSASDYVRTLIRGDQQWRAEEMFEVQLLADCVAARMQRL
jgi:Arc/MetJ-type ribon-helix-helix transcriptional regulator